MTRYLTLLTFTEQGLLGIKESPKRAAGFRAAVEGVGGKMIAQYWSLGPYDGCVIFETPDADAASSILLALEHAGNVRTQTMAVSDAAEFSRIVAKI